MITLTTYGELQLAPYDNKDLGETVSLGVEKEQKALAGVAVDAVFDSVSVATTFKANLAEAGVIFCPFSEALRDHPDLVKQYLGAVVPQGDNYYAALNSAVWPGGSFIYVPPGVHVEMPLQAYFQSF